MALLYDRTKGLVTPFQEDENRYLFRFFCGEKNPTPVEQSMPKGDKGGCVCGCCLAPISVDDVGNGPYLNFWIRPESHYAARERHSKATGKKE